MTHVDEIGRRINEYVEEKVEEVERQLQEVRSSLDDANERIANLSSSLEDRQRTIGVLENENSDLESEVRGLEARVEELLATIEELLNNQGGTTKTLFGSCPEKPGGQSLAAAQKVAEKWGSGVAVRQFKSDLSNPSVDERFSIVHTSYKPNVQDVIAGRLDEKIREVVRATPDGHVLEIWHESDKKVNDGLYSFQDIVAAKNRFYDVVKQTNPKVLVANTVTGWLTDPKSKGDVDRWGQVKADIFGIDCDGVRPTKLPYTNYEDETARALKFIEDFADMGYKWFAVPEYGCPRIVADDPDGVERAKYHQFYADLWKSTGKCLYVCLYEYDSSPNYSLTTTVEIDQWKSLIGN